MTISTNNIDKASPYLLQLFKQDIQAKLVEEAIAHVRPAIAKAAAKAVAEMELTIRSQFTPMSETLIVQFVEGGLTKRNSSV